MRIRKSLDQSFAGFVAEGDDDYIGLWQVANRISSYLDVDQRKMTVAKAEEFWSVLTDFITRMLQNGFEVVTLTENGGCTPWPEQTPSSVMIKIKNAVIEADGNIADAGFGIWFNKLNTTPRNKR